MTLYVRLLTHNIPELNMADEIDMANEQAERWLAQSLANIGKGEPRLVPKGNCHYCETDFNPKAAESAKKLFCDASCSKNYELEQRKLNRR